MNYGIFVQSEVIIAFVAFQILKNEAYGGETPITLEGSDDAKEKARQMIQDIVGGAGGAGGFLGSIINAENTMKCKNCINSQ